VRHSKILPNGSVPFSLKEQMHVRDFRLQPQCQWDGVDL